MILLVCVATFASTFVVNKYIGRDWMPQDDRSEISVSLEMPEGSSLEATEKVTLEMAGKIGKLPEVVAVIPQTMGFIARVTMANITVLLKPQGEREDIVTMGQKVRQVVRSYAYMFTSLNRADDCSLGQPRSVRRTVL